MSRVDEVSLLEVVVEAFDDMIHNFGNRVQPFARVGGRGTTSYLVSALATVCNCIPVLNDFVDVPSHPVFRYRIPGHT